MLQLYYKPSCPYCQKVFAVADPIGVEFDLRDVSEYPELIDELIEKGGKRQVPFLVDTERTVQLYESDDIIQYLKEHYPQGTASEKPRVHVSDNACIACEG